MISIDLDVKADDTAEFPYKYVEVDGVRYKMPISVFKDLKALREETPNLTKFKVKKTGEGINTSYTVIPYL